MSVVLRGIDEDDWERLRELRLRMLADTPLAYAETLEQARDLDEAQWRYRARRTREPGSWARVAVDPATGRWVGTMATFTHPVEGLFLVSVYLDPAWRGSGAADLLLDAALDWARARGTGGIRLHVHEDNARARAYYRRRGFAETGLRVPYGLDPTREEVEMHLVLAPPAVPS